MREFKFRVWDKADYMSTPFTLSEMNNKVEFTNNCPVMQYTGLYDANAKEVYEGDILKKQYGSSSLYVVVAYDEKRAMFINNDGYNEPLHEFPLHFCEIVGNVYENPELLKK